MSCCSLTRERIVIRPVSSEEVQAMVCARGQSPLMVLTDADLSISSAHRMIKRLDETKAGQLVIIAPGRIDDDAGRYLRDPAHRHQPNGKSRDVILIDDFKTTLEELQRVFNLLALKQELSRLDTGLGLPMWTLVSASFDFKEHAALPSLPGLPGPSNLPSLKDIAASAVSSLNLTF